MAPAGCGSDEDDDASGGSGASGTADNTGASGATGGATGSGGSSSSGAGGANENVDCPAPGTEDACQKCAQDNCADEVAACCMQDDAASAMGKKGCYDVVDCARETGCSDAASCLGPCGDDISGAGITVAQDLAAPLGECVIAAVEAGNCPDCVPPGGAGGGGGGN